LYAMLLKVRATRNTCARLFALDWIGLLVNLGSGSRGSVDMEMIYTHADGRRGRWHAVRALSYGILAEPY